MATAEKKRPSRKAKVASQPARGGLHWIHGLVGGAALILATPTMALLAVLLLPALLAAVVDTRAGRPSVRAVGLFGLAGACAPLAELWRSGHQMDEALALGSDLRTIALCWSAQAAGWLATQILPLIIGSVLEAKARLNIKRLEQRRAVLLEEWRAS